MLSPHSVEGVILLVTYAMETTTGLLGAFRSGPYYYYYFFACQVFTSVALFNMLISPLNAFPWVLNGLMEAWVSVKRIQAFLALKNLDLTGYYQQLDYSDKGESKCF